MKVNKKVVMLSAVAVALYSAAMVDWSDGETGKPPRPEKAEGALESLVMTLEWASFTGGIEECGEMAAELAEYLMYPETLPVGTEEEGDVEKGFGPRLLSYIYPRFVTRIEELCKKEGFRIYRSGQAGATLRIESIGE